jgi:putative acetyltransferase
MEIREHRAGDEPTIATLYPQAFPEEDLLPLVRALVDEPSGVLGLAAVIDDRVVGHALFTRCRIEPGAGSAALLGPLAIDPAYQGQGVGAALVREGLARLDKARVQRVFVLGDPAYYRRFGFRMDTNVVPPYSLPQEWAEAWQSLPLSAETPETPGTLQVPAPWQQPGLWAI